MDAPSAPGSHDDDDDASSAAERPVASTGSSSTAQVRVPIIPHEGSGLSLPWAGLACLAYPVARFGYVMTMGTGVSAGGLVFDIIIVLVILALVVRPVMLSRQRGEVVFSAEGMRVHFPGLLTEDWVVPADRVATVKISSRPLTDVRAPVLGVSAHEANALVTFSAQTPAIPARLGFLPPALFAVVRSMPGVPATYTTPTSVCWRAGAVSSDLERQVVAALGGEVAPGLTYRAGGSGEYRAGEPGGGLSSADRPDPRRPE